MSRGEVKYHVGYNIYYAQEGSDAVFCGGYPAYYAYDSNRITPYKFAPQYLWGTEAASGGHRFTGPGQAEEDDEPIRWFGADGNYCVVRYGSNNLRDAIELLIQIYEPKKRYQFQLLVRDWFRKEYPGDDVDFVREFPVGYWQEFAAGAVGGREHYYRILEEVHRLNRKEKVM
jgi:hypothetical protein